MTHLSIVIPVLNEETLIKELIRRVATSSQVVTKDYEILIIDDGSNDDTWGQIIGEARSDRKIRGIKLSRNFGHHYAISAGIHNATGDWIVVMDGDLQDRPEVIPQLYAEANLGFEVVFVSRINRPEKKYYLIAQRLFYFGLKKISGIYFDPTQANFSIISKKVGQAFKLFPENARFYVSTIKWLGFKTGTITAEHGKRYSGTPSYTFKKRVRLAAEIIIAFSERPLRVSIYFGVLVSILSMIGMIIIFYKSLVSGYDVIGWPSLMVSIYFLGGTILTVLGILGIYVGQIFREVKERPLYVIQDKIN
jgi:glycosyltransferase involved in cell wall biosynthesis